jgi:hypothetical protein
MAVLNLQLTSLQENLNVSATPARAPDTGTASTPVNSNVAQGAPAPLDSVTLAGQAGSGQGARQGPDQGPDQNRQALPQQNDLFFAPDFLAASGLGQDANGNKASTVPLPGSTQTGATGASSSASANAQILQGISASGAGAQTTLEESQKQQLQQLDQTLRQLGIDPQSISVFNQLALLFFANNPAGLKQFLSQFQQAAQQLLTQNSSNTAGQNISSAAAAAAAQLGTPATSSTDSSAAGVAAQSTSPSQNSANASPSPADVSIHFQELQFAVAAVGGQLQMSATGSASLQAEGESLNVTF